MYEFHDLPHDVHALIIQYLDGPNMYTAKLVSHEWNSYVTEDSWARALECEVKKVLHSSESTRPMREQAKNFKKSKVARTGSKIDAYHELVYRVETARLFPKGFSLVDPKALSKTKIALEYVRKNALLSKKRAILEKDPVSFEKLAKLCDMDFSELLPLQLEHFKKYHEAFQQANEQDTLRTHVKKLLSHKFPISNASSSSAPHLLTYMFDNILVHEDVKTYLNSTHKYDDFSYKVTPLQYALIKETCVLAILRQRCDTNILSEQGENALHIMIRYRKFTHLDVVINKHCDPYATWNDGEQDLNILEHAMCNDQVFITVVEILHSNHPKVLQKLFSLCPPMLHRIFSVPISSEIQTMVHLLCRNGAIVSLQDEYNGKKALEVLLEHPMRINIRQHFENISKIIKYFTRFDTVQIVPADIDLMRENARKEQGRVASGNNEHRLSKMWNTLAVIVEANFITKQKLYEAELWEHAMRNDTKNV